MFASLTPAQVYALAFGTVLVLVGLIGFAVDSSFGDSGQGDKLIVFEVNGWHNSIHLVSGLAGLAVVPRPSAARLFALAFGPIYAVVTVWGFIVGDQVLGVVAINAADNLLHLVIALVGIAAGLASQPVDAGSAAASPGGDTG